MLKRQRVLAAFAGICRFVIPSFLPEFIRLGSRFGAYFAERTEEGRTAGQAGARGRSGAVSSESYALHFDCRGGYCAGRFWLAILFGAANDKSGGGVQRRDEGVSGASARTGRAIGTE